MPDADYPAHADAALERLAASFAGGEHPKFAAFGATADAQVLVKFPPESTEAAVECWRDLLVCEALALDTLGDHGMDVATTRVADERLTTGFRALSRDALDRLRSLERL